LDLFTHGPKPTLTALRKRLRGLRSVRIVSESDATLAVDLDGVAIDFVEYPYRLLEAPVRGPAGILVASLRHLGAMKLAALARRGLRRDFWDIYAIVRAAHPLPELARDYTLKFERSQADLYHVARALTYFEDAEREEALPDGMTRSMWSAIKRFF